MTLCLKCRQYYFKADDRFCGHCGVALAKLELENDGQVDIPLDASDRIEIVAKAWNSGLANLEIILQDPTEPDILIIPGERRISLKPLDKPTTIRMWLDCDKMLERSINLVYVPFMSTDPNLSGGNLLLAIPKPGQLNVSEECLDIDLVLSRSKENAATERKSFTIPFENTGGSRVKIGIVNRLDEETPIRVELADKKEVWLRGYETREVEFIAWSEVKENVPVDDAFEVTFDGVSEEADQDKTIRLKVKIESPPRLICKKDVKFGELLPKQIKHEIATLYNIGSHQTCKIVDIRSENPCVRPLTKTPITVEPGKAGTSVELLFSTRFDSELIPFGGQKLMGRVLLITDIPDQPEFPLYWKVEILIPKKDFGIFAVDFGTVNSCAVYYDRDNDPVVVKESKDSDYIPSILVFLERDVFLTGQRALDEKPRVPAECVIHSLKRSLLEGKREIFGKEYEPRDLAALIIEQLLLEVARCHRTLPEKITMAVPANFWGPLRRMMRDACERAWDLSKLSIEIIDEPTAAAMYYFYKYRKRYRKISKRKRVLVFDFGGGTLDISIVEIRPLRTGGAEIEPIITRGDNRMGGIDIDITLLKRLAKKAENEYLNFDSFAITSQKRKFKKKYSGMKNHYSTLLYERSRWMEQACNAKEILSFEQDVNFEKFTLFDKNGTRITDSSGNPEHFSTKVRRDQLNRYIKDKLERAKTILLATLEHCGLEPKNINIVLLSGLSCKIPMVRNLIENLFPKARIQSEERFPLKTSVASGASIAYYLERSGGHFKVRRLDKTSYRYGFIEQIDFMSKKFVQLIDINIPFKDTLNCPPRKVDNPRGLRILEIAQHAGSQDVFGFTPPPEVTILGKIDIDEYEGEIDSFLELSMYFSDIEGKLCIEVNGKPMKMTPYGDALENSYL